MSGTPNLPSRRDVLKWSAGGALMAAVGAGCSRGGERARASGGVLPQAAASWPSSVPPSQRKLVIIELTGGHDGLSLMAPLEDGRYRDARPSLALDPATLIDLGGGYGLHPSFSPLNDQGLTILAGVGDSKPSLSHFEMLSRWWAGYPDPAQEDGTGFFGRLCDHLAGNSEVVGVSIGITATPAMASASNSTVNMVSGQPLTFLPPAAEAAQGSFLHTVEAFRGVEVAQAAQLSSLYGRGIRTVLDLNRALESLPARSASFDIEGEGAKFAAELGFASQLIRSDLGVQVVHLAIGQAAFDTHASHNEGYSRAWGELLPGIEIFRAELDRLEISDEVLIATTSEFGRRLGENSGGLDHGSGSCALLMGPVASGVVGEHPSLKSLDEAGNLVPTVGFDRYFATLAAWLDVDPAAVLSASTQPIDSLLTR